MAQFDGLAVGDEIVKYYRKRSQEYDLESINKKLLDDYETEGWEIDAETETRYKVRRRKPIGTLFENEVWCVFAKMGFNEMNASNDFKISFNGNDSINPKQIDVFAKDTETVLVIECKAFSKPGNQSFRTHLLEITGYRDSIVKSIHSHYRGESDHNLKVGFAIATKNAWWSDSDLELAKEKDITVLTEDDMAYYRQLVSHLGPVAKYQLLADIFAEKQIPGLEAVVPAIRGRIGNYKFYAFAIEPSKLLPISFVSHRAKVDKQNMGTYQRMLVKKRLVAIRNYIEGQNGLFPNSIILNFITGNKPLRFDKAGAVPETEAQLGYLYLPNRYKSAWIIDGQHRLYGFSGTSQIDKVTIPVVAFENLDASTQARMFVDINSKQQKVPKNHLEDLYSELLWDSKNDGDIYLAVRSRIVSELGKERSSPFYKKIKPSSGETDNEPLTIGSITEAIDKNRLLGQVPPSGRFRAGPLGSDRLPWNENSKKRAKKVLVSYFTDISEGLRDNWEQKPRDGGFFCSNVGISALMRVLKEILDTISYDRRLQTCDIDVDLLMEDIKVYSKPIIDFYSKPTSIEEIRKLKQFYGAGGAVNAAMEIMQIINEARPEFNPNGLEKWISDKKARYGDQAMGIIKDIQLMIADHIISTLKEVYEGPEPDSWWFASIPTEVKKKAAEKQAEDTVKRPLEQCLDLIHYQKIVIKNWKYLSDVYSFGNKGSKEKQVEWFDKFNKIRNKTFHPENGPVTKEDYDFLIDLKVTLETRIEEASKKEKLWEEGEEIIGDMGSRLA